MASPRLRLAVSGGALILLAAVGGGLVQASSVQPATAPSAVGAAALPAAATTDQADVLAAALRLRARGSIVHGTVTVDGPKDGLVTVQVDGGTIAAVSAESVTVAEKGGGSVTVAIDSDTRVRRDRKRAAATDLKVGDIVRVVSRVADGGATTAKAIVVTPASGS